jgi:aspartate/methionine/tyrosine aminotransferase
MVEGSRITGLADLARDDPAVIKLWIGEGDLPTPSFIRDAATAALDAGATRYTYSLGLPALREALSDYHARHWRVEVPPERFAVTVGGMNAIMQACQAVLEPGDEVIVPSPAWPNVSEAIRIVGATPVPLLFETVQGKFTLPVASFAAAITDRTRAIIVNSPSNPTGWIMPEDEMVELLELTRSRGLWLISDEVYNRFTYDGAVARSFLEFASPGDRLIVTNTFSKNWAMTGWRAGWLIYPPGLEMVFDNLGQYNTTSIPTFVQHAAIAALRDGDSFVQELVARCAESRAVFCDGLAALPGLTVYRPDGTFYLLIRAESEEDSFSIATRILREAKVGLAPGIAFGAGGDRYLRICFAISPALAREALDRLGGWIHAGGLERRPERSR